MKAFLISWMKVLAFFFCIFLAGSILTFLLIGFYPVSVPIFVVLVLLGLTARIAWETRHDASIDYQI